MLLVFANRHELVELAASHPINHMVELGVYEGEFSEHCYSSLDLKRYTLIDFWEYDEYSFVLENSPQMRGLRAVHGQYFHNDPKRALSAAYEKTRSRFAEKHDVEILKMDIARAVNRFGDGSLGSHSISMATTLTNSYSVTSILGSRSCGRGGCWCNDFFESSFELCKTSA